MKRLFTLALALILVISAFAQSPQKMSYQAIVRNSQGKLVKRDIIESTMIEKQINMQDLAGGIYYLKLVKGKLVNVYKVVKL